MGRARRSKFHHVVPKAVLRHFCYSGEKIWYHSKKRVADGVCSRDINKKFGRRHFYSVETESGEKSDAFERDFLQILDSKYAELTREIIRVVNNGRIPKFDQSTNEFFLQFFYYYRKRSYDFTEKLNIYSEGPDLIANSIEEYERQHGPVEDEKKIELLKEESVESIVEYARVIALSKTSEEVTARLRKMNLIFASPPRNKQFIIGSNPVIRFDNRRNATLGEGDVELWTPMTPNIAVGLVGPAQLPSEKIEFSRDFARIFNIHMYKSSTEVGSQSERLLKSIVSD